MNIVVLDGYALNPGDLSWDALANGQQIAVYERTADADFFPRAESADILVTNKTPISAAAIAKLKNLKLIAVTATGFNVVDIAAAKKHGVLVCNVPAYSTDSVAQHAIGLLLELSSRIGLHAGVVMSGEWAKSPDFCDIRSPLVELAGKTFGIVGFGTIGQRTGKIAHALGMNVLAVQRRSELPKVDYPVSGVTLPVLFAQSDVVSLHCPLTAENAGFVNAKLLATMKPCAFLINTARGGLVNELELAAAVSTGIIAGYGGDVLTQEPPEKGSPLIGNFRCVITPHIAWASAEARRRCMNTSAKNIQAFLAGKPVNVVN